MRTRQHIDRDLAEVQKRLTRAQAHFDLEQVAYLVTEYDRLLDEILASRKANHV